MIPPGEFELSRVVDRCSRLLGEPSKHLWLASFVAVGSCVVRLPGMRPSAPKRNVIVGLVYLYALVILASVGSV